MSRTLTNTGTNTGEAGIEAALRDILGPEGVSTDPRLRALYGQDVYARGAHEPALIARPRDAQSLARALAAVTSAGLAAVPRGGGMSYTSGFHCAEPDTVLFDLTGMDRILDIDAEDMTVTVQAGVTWKALYDALKARGLRTPFWGPLSGLNSTIGGGLSQNNAFFGAGTYGPTADSVTSLTVALADGTLLKTGTAGTKGARPFFRHYGPDLTGLFLGDTGSLGFKAEATFRLVPYPAAEGYASFEFRARDACAEATAGLARAGLGCEVFGFDPNLTAVRLKRASLAADLRSLGSVVRGQGGVLKGMREAAKIAVAGRSFVAPDTYSVHIVCEGRSRAGVDADLDAARRIASEAGGHEVADTIPKVIRANPFTAPNNMIGPEGERWVPIHGIVPHSAAARCWADLDEAFAAMRDDLDRHGVTTGFLVTTLSTNGFLIEPVFLWPDALDDLHRQAVDGDVLARIRGFDDNPAGRAVVERARQAVLAVFERHGAAHFQIGRTYPYAKNRKAPALDLLRTIKRHVDPDGRVNPGVLGL